VIFMWREGLSYNQLQQVGGSGGASAPAQ
jgi:hypothetical protein